MRKVTWKRQYANKPDERFTGALIQFVVIDGCICALIEMDDGSIACEHVENIKFVNEEPWHYRAVEMPPLYKKIEFLYQDDPAIYRGALGQYDNGNVFFTCSPRQPLATDIDCSCSVYKWRYAQEP